MKKVKEHFEQIASSYDKFKRKNWYYFQNINQIPLEKIKTGKKILDIGCGTGTLLLKLKPSYGVGIDISEMMIKIARQKNKSKKIFFWTGKIEKFSSRQKFDYIIMVDVIEHLENIQSTVACLKKFVHKNSEILIVMVNPLWEPILMILEKLKLKMPEGPHNRINGKVLEKIFKKNNFVLKEHSYGQFTPLYIPLLSDFLNRNIPRIPFLKKTCLSECFIFKLK